MTAGYRRPARSDLVHATTSARLHRPHMASRRLSPRGLRPAPVNSSHRRSGLRGADCLCPAVEGGCCLASLHGRPSGVGSSRGGAAWLLDGGVLSALEVPPSGDDPAAARRGQAEALVVALDRSRDLLEELRSWYLRRLHSASDDFGATEGLRVVEAALVMIPRADSHGTRQRHQREGSRGWRRRGVRP